MSGVNLFTIKQPTTLIRKLLHMSIVDLFLILEIPFEKTVIIIAACMRGEFLLKSHSTSVSIGLLFSCSRSHN